MNWLCSFLSWLASLWRLGRAPMLGAMARGFLLQALDLLEQRPAHALTPDEEADLRACCASLLHAAQSLIAAYIRARMQAIAGETLSRPAIDFTILAAQPSRDAIRKRARDLLRRLAKAEAVARRRARRIQTSRFNSALSPAFPAQAGIQTARDSALIVSRLLFVAFGAESGPPPARGTRSMKFAQKTGPPIGAAIPINRI